MVLLIASTSFCSSPHTFSIAPSFSARSRLLREGSACSDSAVDWGRSRWCREGVCAQLSVRKAFSY